MKTLKILALLCLVLGGVTILQRMQIRRLKRICRRLDTALGPKFGLLRVLSGTWENPRWDSKNDGTGEE